MQKQQQRNLFEAAFVVRIAGADEKGWKAFVKELGFGKTQGSAEDFEKLITGRK